MQVEEIVAPKQRVASLLVHIEPAASGHQDFERVSMGVEQALEEAFPAWVFVDLI